MGFCNQLPQTWRLNPAHIYSLTLPEARNPEPVALGGPRGVSRATSTQRLCFVAFPAPGASFPGSWSLPPRSKPAASKPAAQQLQIFLTPSPIASAFRYLPLIIQGNLPISGPSVTLQRLSRVPGIRLWASWAWALFHPPHRHQL